MSSHPSRELRGKLRLDRLSQKVGLGGIRKRGSTAIRKVLPDFVVGSTMEE